VKIDTRVRPIAGREFDVDENLACDMFEAHFVGLRMRLHHARSPICAAHRFDPFGPDRACQHNVNIGAPPLRASATSCAVSAKNWSNTTFIASNWSAASAIESRERLSPSARAGETAVFGLRMNAGWPFWLFRRNWI
jgi:hypothetical protein